MRYPLLEQGTVIGVTAPSSGVGEYLHNTLQQACQRMTERGYGIKCGNTVWTQNKAKSAPARIRAAELNEMIRDSSIGIIIPPWGGELLIEILPWLDLQAFSRTGGKWMLGYSDTSVLLLAATLTTGIASAHGTNLMDLRAERSDDTTAMWQAVLSTPPGGSITQHSSAFYQKQWDFENPTPSLFHLTEPTRWETVSGAPETFSGRLLGGCVDVIRHLIGTPFGDVKAFQRDHIHNEPIVWYLENAEMNVADLRRSLVQMRLAGWFDNCSGILFGRSPANKPVEGYTALDVYRDLADELKVPIVYDVDCGHMPPQLTLINGASAEVQVDNGAGIVKQYFRS